MRGLPKKIAALAAALIAGFQAANADDLGPSPQKIQALNADGLGASSQKNQAVNAEDLAPSQQNNQVAIAEDLGPSLRKIKETGAIAIGFRESAIPMSYTDAQQQPVGFALDLCALVANKVKQTLGLEDLKINYKSVTPADSAALIADGTIDLDCSGVPVKPDEQNAAFSVPVLESELKWIVRRKLRVEREGRRRTRWETISPSSTEDLKGQTVVLPQGSSATLLVLNVSSDRSLGLSIVMGKDNLEAFRLLETGKASAFLADGVLLAGLMASAKNPDSLGFLDEAYSGQAYALMLRKNDKPFKDLVDGALTEAMSSGEYAKLYTKWFESPIPPNNVNLAIPMPRKLKELVKMPPERVSRP